MKHFNRYHLGILPLLSILAMSPSVMESQYASRSIASLEQLQDPPAGSEETKSEEKKSEEQKEVVVETTPLVDNPPVIQTELKDEEPKEVVVETTPLVDNPPVIQTELKEEVRRPRLEAAVAKVDKGTLTEEVKLSKEVVSQKLSALLEQAKAQKDSVKESSDEAEVKLQREQIESLIKELVVIEIASGSGELSPEEKEAQLKLLAEGKDLLESLLGSLESNEELVAQAKESKEDAPVVVEAEEPKKEEPKTEEPKAEETKTEVAESKEEPKKDICEADEKNKVLTTQVEELMKQNQQILQTMLGMAQMMISMHQQSSNQGIYQQYQMPMGNPYMYQQPMTAGNWVYYPSGFGPTQQNIFAQPMQQPMMQQMSMYPDQMHQQQPQWNLRPSQYSFGDPRFQNQPMSYGTFGNEAFSFNMTNTVPTVSQI